MKHGPLPERTAILLIITLFILGGAFGFISYRYRAAQFSIRAAKEQNTAQSATIAALEYALKQSEEDNRNLLDALTREQHKMFVFEEQIKAIFGAVGNLEKLSKTDPELLKKYSKVYFLNENYEPEGLIDINPAYVYPPNGEPELIHEKVAPFLMPLLADAKANGTDLQVISAYRSFGKQAGLKSEYTFIYGAGTANQFSADQGYSEHQLGTTVDFTTPKNGGVFSGFQKTNAYTWLLQNAHRYGFVLSYPENNWYYEFEPWHWRFVGVALATDLHNTNRRFYDIDQREIDTYLINLFDPM